MSSTRNHHNGQKKRRQRERQRARRSDEDHRGNACKKNRIENNTRASSSSSSVESPSPSSINTSAAATASSGVTALQNNNNNKKKKSRAVIPGHYFDEDTQRYYRVDEKRTFVKNSPSSSSSALASASPAAVGGGQEEENKMQMKRSKPRGAHDAHNGIWSELHLRQLSGMRWSRHAMHHLLRSRFVSKGFCSVDYPLQRRAIRAQKFLCLDSSDDSQVNLVASKGHWLVYDKLARNDAQSPFSLQQRHWEISASSQISSMSHCTHNDTTIATTLGGAACGDVYLIRQTQLPVRVFSFKRRSIWCSAFNHDGSMLALGASKEGIVLDTATWRPKCRTFCKDRSDTFCQVFDLRNENVLYSGLRSGEVRFVDVRAARKKTFFRRERFSLSTSVITLDAVGEYELLVSSVSGELAKFDTRKLAQPTTGQTASRRPQSLVRFEGHKNKTTSVEVPVLATHGGDAGVGDFVAAAGSDNQIRLWDLQRGGEPFHILQPLHHNITCMQWLPHNSQNPSLMAGGFVNSSSTHTVCGIAVCKMFQGL